MPRFGLKVLIYLMTFVAAYATLLGEARRGPGWAALVAYFALVGLISWWFYSYAKAEKAMMSKDGEREKRAE